MDSGFSLADIGAMLGNRDGNGFGSSGGAIVLIILFALIFLGGGGLFGNRGNNGNAVTEAQLCNSTNFNNLENAVGRLNDSLAQQNMMLSNGLCNLGYQTQNQFGQVQRDMCTAFSATDAAINQARYENKECCCQTQQSLLENRYLAAQNTADINATVTAQTQKILDAICGNRISDMQNQINALQLQNAVAGVVKYPSTFAYNAGTNPFCGGCGCCG
jgi:hypothetical protein